MDSEAFMLEGRSVRNLSFKLIGRRKTIERGASESEEGEQKNSARLRRIYQALRMLASPEIVEKRKEGGAGGSSESDAETKPTEPKAE